jgi:hypothetical protein
MARDPSPVLDFCTVGGPDLGLRIAHFVRERKPLRPPARRAPEPLVAAEAHPKAGSRTR